ncbi:DUF2867 domain-containing protein [Primorskyibacter sp. 2E107]|uniref:DUF2867 domain-containing protein n=1 Tax=Primorskyibacter sp. 2E107 TaxID=3403458 RepID=UPI003AF8F6BF
MRAKTAQIQIVAAKDSLDFFDSQSADVHREYSPLDVYARISADMKDRMGWAFKIRDALSAPFGVRRIGGFSGQVPNHVQPGDRLDFFRVEASRDTMLVLTERDRHLDVMTCISCQGTMVTITSSVVTHNAFGRVYMMLVGPAHRMIVKGQIKRLARNAG